MTNLKQVAGARTISLGGIYPDPMAYFSFPGGMEGGIMGYNTVKNFYNITDSRFPNELPLSASMAMNTMGTLLSFRFSPIQTFSTLPVLCTFWELATHHIIHLDVNLGRSKFIESSLPPFVVSLREWVSMVFSTLRT